MSLSFRGGMPVMSFSYAWKARQNSGNESMQKTGHTSRCSTVFTANWISISSAFPAFAVSNDMLATSPCVKFE